MTAYVANVRCFHRPSAQVVEPGEPIDVSHLTPDEILMLEDMEPPAIRRADDDKPPADGGQED
jgi:hypothetical protein